MKKDFIGGLIITILIGVLVVGITTMYLNKIEKIENNEMTLVNQNQMDR